MLCDRKRATGCAWACPSVLDKPYPYYPLFIFFWLVVWNMNFMTFHSVGKKSIIFQGGRYPPTSIDFFKNCGYHQPGTVLPPLGVQNKTSYSLLDSRFGRHFPYQNPHLTPFQPHLGTGAGQRPFPQEDDGVGSWGKTGFPPEISGSFWDVFKRIGRRKKMNIFSWNP